MTRDPKVDSYLATLPADQRELLEGIRATIARIAPDALETISYGMPAFKLEGKLLVSYAGWKSHCSIYPLTDTFLAAHRSDLDGFDTTKGSVHFTPAAPLPGHVLEDLVLARRADLEGGGR